MKRVRVPIIACLTIMTIAACSKHDPVAADVKPMSLPLPTNTLEPDPLGGPPENSSAETSAAPATPGAVTIPSSLQGRWGLTPADCTASKNNAKGLLIVDAGHLHFYESSATASADVDADPGSINGHFDFTADGRNWTKFEALTLNGDKLTRTETNPAASYTYAKC